MWFSEFRSFGGNHLTPTQTPTTTQTPTPTPTPTPQSHRLDKAMIKYNEAQSIRTTYTQIVKRLKEERVGFDNQLQALERTLKSKQRDYEELLFLSGDANHAREVSQMELSKVKGAYEEEVRWKLYF